MAPPPASYLEVLQVFSVHLWFSLYHSFAYLLK